jgi:dihydroorotase-like cyclic amidohydrolase
MEESARLSSMMVVHAEDEAAIARLTGEIRASGRKDPLAWAESRPPFTESDAVSRALTLAAQVGCRLQLAHLSTAAAVLAAAGARRAGSQVAVETCPHFLLLDESQLERRGSWAKTAPPLRSRAQQEALWDCVREQQVDFLVSDHAPWEMTEKQAGLESIWEAPNGLQSLQLMTILTLEAWTGRGLPLERFVTMTSAAPARWLGIFPQKGAVRAGSDADIAVYRRGASRPVTAGELLDRQPWTPFEGLHTTFSVVATLLRGSWVFADGAVKGNPAGRFMPLSGAMKRGVAEAVHAGG